MKLKELRIAEHHTQQEISKSLNIPLTTYNNYEKERSEPNIETLIKFADYFHVTLDYLVDREVAGDVGYLRDEEKELLQLSKQLSTKDLCTLVAFAKGIIASKQ